ncbi:MAG: putative ABC transporter permease subunit [Ktedonobacteraceae bacterium]
MEVHADKLRWLFWLRWKTLLRGYSRRPLSIVGSIFVLLFIILVGGTIAAISFVAYRLLPAPANSEILYLVLTAVMLLWIMLPLLEFTTNEGLDASKLVLFPLTRVELMASLLFSTLLDIPTIGLVLVLVAVIAGWAVSLPVTLLASVTMLIFYIQVVGISQLVLALFMRILQGRRFRDLSIIIIALFTSSCYLIQQFVLGGTRIIHLYENLKSASFSPFLKWVPSGLAASSITQAVQGNWGASLATLALLLVTSALTLYLWQVVLQRSLSASEVGAARARGRRRQQTQTPVVATAVQPASANIWERFLPPQISALTIKELKYFWRDPQLKAMMFQSVIYVAIFLVAPLLNPNSSSFGGNGYVLLITPMVVILFMLTFSLNVLGLERQSLTTLFLFPVAPQRILWGKNLAVLTLGVVELVVLIAVGAFITHAWNFVLPVLVGGLAGMGVALGCGNITSVYFPQYTRQMQRGFRASGQTSQAGCLRAVMSFAILIVSGILLIPVALSLGLPIIFNAEWIWIITMPLSLIYGIAFHQIATRRVAPRMLERAPEILAITTRE